MLLLRIARGESVGILLEPLSVIKYTTLERTASLYDRTGVTIHGSPHHILFSCLLYQLEFPTLFLAIREIIANALLKVRISPRTICKITTFSAKKNDFPLKNFDFRRKTSSKQRDDAIRQQHIAEELACRHTQERQGNVGAH